MSKSIVLIAIIAVAAMVDFAAARPGLLAPATIVHAPATIVRVAPVVHALPAAISHQSHTQIHTRPLVTSVVHAAPLPLVHAPLVHSHVIAAAPIVHTAHHHGLAGPLLVHG